METIHFTPEQLTERFEFPQKLKNVAFGLIGIGIVLLIAGYFLAGGSDHAATGGEHASVAADIHAVADTHGSDGHGTTASTGQRLIANVLLSSLYFVTLTMGAFFFLTIHRVGNAGWQTAVRRVAEAIISYLPVGIVSLAALFFFLDSVFEWAHLPAGVDALIDEKRAYLNEPFFIVRSLFFFGAWFGAAWYLRKLSLDQDREGGLSHFNRSGVVATLFIIFFALSYSLFAVDWIKSLEPHWFSTIFGIYVFAGSMVSAMVTMWMITYFLKKQGYMGYVNESHLHDIGKYAFGFTVFWGYIWVAQYLLIWYSNIPEEGIYYVKRYRVEDHAYLGYATVFYVNVIINFIIPFIALMTRDAKRIGKIFLPVGALMLYGHWHDLFVMVMPGAVGYNPGIGLIEIGTFLTFAGIFIFVVFNALTKANLVPINHPYLEESLHHTTGPV